LRACVAIEASIARAARIVGIVGIVREAILGAAAAIEV
jgi:hypothetical protein